MSPNTDEFTALYCFPPRRHISPNVPFTGELSFNDVRSPERIIVCRIVIPITGESFPCWQTKHETRPRTPAPVFQLRGAVAPT